MEAFKIGYSEQTLGKFGYEEKSRFIENTSFQRCVKRFIYTYLR
jgi:hypothetical protein